MDLRFGFAVLHEGGKFDLALHETPFSQDEIEEFENLVRVVADLRPMVIDHISLEFDFYALEDAVPWTRKAVSLLEHPFGPTGIINTFVLAQTQRMLSNFLSSASAFRDRLSCAISDKFGAVSDEVEAWKSAQRDAYDTSFAYRLLYGLRNYAMHHEAPIDLVRINGRRGQDGVMEHSFELALYRDKLFADKRLKSRVRNELEAMGEALPLIPLATEYMKLHRKFALDMMLRETPRLAVLEGFATRLFQRSDLPPGAVPIVWEGGPLSADGERPSSENPITRGSRSLGLDELIMLKVLAGRLHHESPPRIEMGLGWI